MAEPTAPSASSVSPDTCLVGDYGLHVWTWRKGPHIPFWIGECLHCRDYNWRELRKDLLMLGVDLEGK